MLSIIVLSPLRFSFSEIRVFSLISVLVCLLSACQKKDSASPSPTNFVSITNRIIVSTNSASASALSYYVKGLCAEGEENLKSALSYYELAFAKDDSYSELGPFLIQEYLKQGQPNLALKPLQKLIQQDPNNSELYTQQGLIYSLQKQSGLAYQSLEKALYLNSTNYFAYALLYQLTASNSPASALELLKTKAPTLSSNTLFWQSVGESYASLLTDQEALAINSSQVAQKTLPLFQKALDLSPTNLVLLLRLAELNELATNHHQAIALYQKAIPLSTNREPIETRLAAAYFNIKNIEKAIQTLETILQRNPKNPALNLTLANLYYQAGDTNKLQFYLKQAEAQGMSERLLGDFAIQIKNWPLAETYLKNLTQKTSADPEAWIQLANALSQQKKTQEAETLLQQAQKKFPATAELFLMSSLLARENRQWTQASNYLYQTEQIITHSPKPSLSRDEISYQWGIFYEQTKDFEKAETYFKKAISLNPNHHQAMNYLSYMWIDHKIKFDEALKLINQALTYEPKNPAYLDTLGWLYFQQANYEKALPLIQEAFELSLYDGEIGEHLGDIYLKMNQPKKALELWQKALKTEPARESLQKKIQDLSR